MHAKLPVPATLSMEDGLPNDYSQTSLDTYPIIKDQYTLLNLFKDKYNQFVIEFRFINTIDTDCNYHLLQHPVLGSLSGPCNSTVFVICEVLFMALDLLILN